MPTETEQPKTVGERILCEREARHWTQFGLGMRATVTPSQLSNYERNVCQPSLATAARIARAFEISLDQLVNGTRDHE